MVFVANSCMVVGKDTFTTQAGKTFYKLLINNGRGNPVTVSSTPEAFGAVVPMGKLYDMEIDFKDVGYNIYADLVNFKEQ